MSSATVLNIFVKGFNDFEHRLLAATVKLSQRRMPQLVLVDELDAASSDVVMVDAQDPEAMHWAATQPWLKRKPVIWVGAESVPDGGVSLKRPVLWPVLPMILARALDTKGQNLAEKAAVAVSSAFGEKKVLRSVLVVDDSLAVRQYLRSLLEKERVAVTAVDSAEKAIAMDASNYGCILMDVLMPGVDGYEACRRIKAKHRAGSGPAVVMLTSRASPFDRIRGKMAGCDAYLTKPVDEQQLHEVLSRYVGA